MQSQYASNDMKQRSPTSMAEKGFVFGSGNIVKIIFFSYINSPFSGKIVLEASLDKEVFYHGEDIPVHVSLNNNSKKTAKSIAVNMKYKLFAVNNKIKTKNFSAPSTSIVNLQW